MLRYVAADARHSNAECHSAKERHERLAEKDGPGRRGRGGPNYGHCGDSTSESAFDETRALKETGAPPAHLRFSTPGRPHLRRTSFHPSRSPEKEILGHVLSVQTRRVVGHTVVGHQVYRWTTHFNPVIVPSASSETMTGPSVSKTNSGKEIEGHAVTTDQKFLEAPWEIEVRCILPSSTARQMLLQEAEDGYVFLRSIDLDLRSRDISAGLLGNRHALVNVGKAMWTSA